MDLLKKIKDVFTIKEIERVYIPASTDVGLVHEIFVYGFGEKEVEDYENVETVKGRELFKTCLKRLYHTVLYRDPNWHYFIEGSYNIIRFSYDFWDEIRDILELHEANFDEEPRIWIDDQKATRNYQDVFQKMFHAFSLMPMQNYKEEELQGILDRVIHCFMNHQMLFVPKTFARLGSTMEAQLIAHNAVARASYIGYLDTWNSARGAYQRKLDDYKATVDEMISELKKDLGAEDEAEEAENDTN